MNCLFHKYADIFGKPNTGIHSYRFLNFAIVDIILTLIGAFVISYSFNINFILTLFILILLGIILHRLFCVNTTLNKIIFGNI